MLTKDLIIERLQLPYRIGLTTSMLIEALLAAENGKRVIIKAHNYGYAKELEYKVKLWANMLGIEADLISAESIESNSYHSWDTMIFVDHHVYEID